MGSQLDKEDSLPPTVQGDTTRQDIPEVQAAGTAANEAKKKRANKGKNNKNNAVEDADEASNQSIRETTDRVIACRKKQAQALQEVKQWEKLLAEAKAQAEMSNWRCKTATRWCGVMGPEITILPQPRFLHGETMVLHSGSKPRW